jgi:hypothetical protein
MGQKAASCEAEKAVLKVQVQQQMAPWVIPVVAIGTALVVGSATVGVIAATGHLK